jgi:hypothetical protein
LAFEEYQFLRYFIPGSLFVIYVSFLAIPNIDGPIIPFLLRHPDILIGIVGGAFGASLAFGYLVYSFYDWTSYNRLAMHCSKGKRRILGYMGEKIEDWDSSDPQKKIPDSQKKEFLDMLYRLLGNEGKNQQIADMVRGIWSHFNARIVCAIFVPILAGASVFLFHIINLLISPYMSQWTLENHLTSSIVFNFQWFFVVPWLIAVFVISLFLGLGATRPYEEACTVEYFSIRHKIECENSENLTTEFEGLVTKFLRKNLIE